MKIIFLLTILAFCGVLIKSADMVIIAVRRISKNLGASSFAVSAMVLAVGTSFPELFVSITSAIEKTPNLSFGVVLGSNIANIAFIASTAAVFAGRVHVYGNYLRRDVWIAFFAGILPILLAIDGTLGKVDGLILVVMYLAYATSFFRKRYEEIGREQQQETFFYRFLRKAKNISSTQGKELGRLFVGIALLLFSSDVIVKMSSSLAAEANIPIFVIGLFVVALGTSLPELAFSIRALGEGEPSMFFGNILGSTIANSTLIIGLSSIIEPIRLKAFQEYINSALFFVVAFLLFTYFIKSKHRLDRWEAFFMLGIYITFILFELKFLHF